MERAARTVRAIPVKPIFDKTSVEAQFKKQKVAAYCRVSTGSEEQLTSYTLQCEYYTKFITNNSNWELVDIYADEGITGTSVKKRKNFLRMIEDCRAGKIDVIYCKSISRFARNTIDCLTYIRELRELGIDVVFENGGIHTLSDKGEIVLAVLASQAEEGSRIISENVMWAKHKRFENGEVSWAYKYFLGYKKGENGTIDIVPEEAVIVRRIYGEFLDGSTVSQIANGLEADGIKTTRGGEKWQRSTILSILKNEKYKGDALLQKTYKRDFLSKKRVKNEGQAQQFEVLNSHPPIISRETFDLVQAELLRRNDSKDGQGNAMRYSSEYPFSGRLRCAECGATLKRGNRNNPNKSEPIWCCPTHRENKEQCVLKAVKEQAVEQAFVVAFNDLVGHRFEAQSEWESEIANYEISTLDSKKFTLTELQGKMLELNIQHRANCLSGDEYHEQGLLLMNQMDELISDIKRIENLKQQALLKDYRINEIDTLNEVTEFDATLFKTLVEEVVLFPNRTAEFRFKCGVVIRADIR